MQWSHKFGHTRSTSSGGSDTYEMVWTEVRRVAWASDSDSCSSSSYKSDPCGLMSPLWSVKWGGKIWYYSLKTTTKPTWWHKSLSFPEGTALCFHLKRNSRSRHQIAFPAPGLMLKAPSVALTGCFVLCPGVGSIIACDQGSRFTKTEV